MGKEGNRLDDRLNGLVTDPDDYRTVYEDPARRTWSELVLPVLATMPRAEVVSLSGLSRRTIERYLYRAMRPHKKHEDELTRIAVDHARVLLAITGRAVRDPILALHLYRHHS
jgi:hypothetical protein